MLAKFRKAKESEIAGLVRAEACGKLEVPANIKRPDFAKTLTGPHLAAIAEYKRASPSRGVIRNDLGIAEVSRQYLDAGAAAISILTEERYFDGKLDYIEQAQMATDGKIPLLRKDFIFHPLQIKATAQTPAAAVLLIARFYSGADELRKLRELAESFDMDAVVEVFDKSDLSVARDAGAKIIQVNARDLASLKTSRSDCLKLIEKCVPQGREIWIAASGMSRPEHLLAAADAGFAAALIGGALMEKGSPGENLFRLLAGAIK